MTISDRDPYGPPAYTSRPDTASLIRDAYPVAAQRLSAPIAAAVQARLAALAQSADQVALLSAGALPDDATLRLLSEARSLAESVLALPVPPPVVWRAGDEAAWQGRPVQVVLAPPTVLVRTTGGGDEVAVGPDELSLPPTARDPGPDPRYDLIP